MKNFKNNSLAYYSPDTKTIYINFCNPWPKGQHRKKRLTHTRQLEKYKTFFCSILVVGFCRGFGL